MERKDAAPCANCFREALPLDWFLPLSKWNFFPRLPNELGMDGRAVAELPHAKNKDE